MEGKTLRVLINLVEKQKKLLEKNVNTSLFRTEIFVYLWNVYWRTSVLDAIKDSKNKKCIGYIFATFIPYLIQFSLIIRHNNGDSTLTQWNENAIVLISYPNVEKSVEH